jgi:hypothetical protein
MALYPREKLEPTKKKEKIEVRGPVTIQVNADNKGVTGTEQEKGSSKDEMAISFRNEVIMDEMRSPACASAQKTGLICFNMILRSPERIVRYLGELIAAQHFLEKPFSPYLFANAHETFEIFKVERGLSHIGRAVLTTRDAEGETWVAPAFSHSDPLHPRTLQTLSFVMDIVNMAVSAKDLPEVNTLNVIAP